MLMWSGRMWHVLNLKWSNGKVIEDTVIKRKFKKKQKRKVKEDLDKIASSESRETKKLAKGKKQKVMGPILCYYFLAINYEYSKHHMSS